MVSRPDRPTSRPANQSPIVLWPYPIDPWPGEPLPDEYDLLIYAKNGDHPQLLEHLAELFPRHVQIHYGRYQREQLFEAARRSRACAYLADDDHGPLALQEILRAGCPTVGVRTGASCVEHGLTGFLVDRLPPDGNAWRVTRTKPPWRPILTRSIRPKPSTAAPVRERTIEAFGTDRIVGTVICALDTVRFCAANQ